MNLCLFFEGTGRGVAGKVTNVTRLRDICVDDVRQKLHLEAGPGIPLGSCLCGKIAGSESFLDSTRMMVVIGSRLARGCVAVVDGVEVPDGYRGWKAVA